MDERDRYSKGMEVRRAVLGDAHVDRSIARSNAFNEEFQDLITRYAWGEIWARPGLPRHTPNATGCPGRTATPCTTSCPSASTTAAVKSSEPAEEPALTTTTS